jgi:anaerobic magnesium-protoporphyrin IX monomethyl ester cyclase
MKRLLLGVPRKHSLDALYPPVGLLYVAAAAQLKGHQVKVIDGQVEGDDAILSEFRQTPYDYFGTTILTPLREASFDLVRTIKKIRPSCTTIAGGAHVSLLPELVLHQVPELDIAVIGEGEGTIQDLLSGIPAAETPGIWYRNGDLVIYTGNRPLLEPDQIPLPAWDLLDIAPYRPWEIVMLDGIPYGEKPFLTIYSSRGCTGSCSFCSTWRIWKKWRQLPVEHLVDQIETLFQRGVKHFFFADDSMINDEHFVASLADQLDQRRLMIHYKIACRADKVTPEVVRHLKRSGCYEVHVGFESGSQRVLDAIGKRLTVADNIRAAQLIRQAGMRVYALIIIGTMAENINSINETIAFLKLIQPDEVATMGGLMLLPGTRDFEAAVRCGHVTGDFWEGPQPYCFYTGSFSEKQLRMLTLAVTKGCKIWSPHTMSLELILRHPAEFANIMGLSRAPSSLLRLYAVLLRQVKRALQGGCG